MARTLLPSVLHLFVLFFVLLSGASAQGNEVKASLVIHRALTPLNDDVFLGVKFNMKPGWHIYWKYPGDAGLPTKITWTVPEDLTVSELLWPAPQIFSQGSSLIGYGYSDEVVLLNKLSVPNNINKGTLSAEVKWLGCNQSLCVPGSDKFSIPLEDIVSGDSTHASDLSKWIAALPVQDSSALLTDDISVSGSGSKVDVQARLSWKISPVKVEWFPNLGNFLKASNVLLNTKDTTTTLSFSLEFLPGGSSNVDILDSVLVYQSKTGERLAVMLPLPLKRLNN